MSTAAISVDPREIQALFHRHKITEPSKYREYTLFADRIARIVEQRWSDLPVHLQDVFKGVAYGLTSRPTGPKRILRTLQSTWTAAWINFKGEDAAAWAFHASVGRMVTSILDAVERSQPKYHEAVERAVSEALGSREAHQPMSPEEFSEWLTRVSDKAH